MAEKLIGQTVRTHFKEFDIIQTLIAEGGGGGNIGGN